MNLDQVISFLAHQFQTDLWPQSIQVVIMLAPIFLAILLSIIAWDLWVDYTRSKNFLTMKYTTLELTLPRDTFKSPKAMELVLGALHNTSDGSKFSQYWKGETRPWYSLELCSIEGAVKYVIWAQDARKVNLMSALYSQFPDIDIKEIPDYTNSMHFDPNETRIWAAEFKYSSKDPFPIKTYVDYGLDKDPKEEFKVDPILPMLEFLGSVGPNQQVWIQFVVRAHLKNKRKAGKFFELTDPWADSIRKKVNDIMLRNAKTKVSGEVNEDGYSKMPTLSEGEKEQVAALDRRLYKMPFDVGIRTLYIAKKEIFNTPFGIGGIVASLKHFNTEHLNGFKPNGDRWHPRLGDPWLDFNNIRRNRYARQGLQAFKMRSYFYSPYKHDPLVMNVEELATIYHFPGSVSQTPNLGRVPSKRAQAPGNLPT